MSIVYCLPFVEELASGLVSVPGTSAYRYQVRSSCRGSPPYP